MASNFPVRDGKIVIDGVQQKTNAQKHIIAFLVAVGAADPPKP